jgi:hypothetical protein
VKLDFLRQLTIEAALLEEVLDSPEQLEHGGLQQNVTLLAAKRGDRIDPDRAARWNDRRAAMAMIASTAATPASPPRCAVAEGSAGGE